MGERSKLILFKRGQFYFLDMDEPPIYHELSEDETNRRRRDKGFVEEKLRTKEPMRRETNR